MELLVWKGNGRYKESQKFGEFGYHVWFNSDEDEGVWFWNWESPTGGSFHNGARYGTLEEAKAACEADLPNRISPHELALLRLQRVAEMMEA